MQSYRRKLQRPKCNHAITPQCDRLGPTASLAALQRSAQEPAREAWSGEPCPATLQAVAHHMLTSSSFVQPH